MRTTGWKTCVAITAALLTFAGGRTLAEGSGGDTGDATAGSRATEDRGSAGTGAGATEASSSSRDDASTSGTGAESRGDDMSGARTTGSGDRSSNDKSTARPRHDSSSSTPGGSDAGSETRPQSSQTKSK